MKVTEILSEISLGTYSKKATMDRAMNQMSAAFGKPEDKEKYLRKAAVRDKGLARAKTRYDKIRAAADEKARADSLARDRANRGNMEAELANLQKQFDPSFEYSDDYSFWSKQRDIQSKIRSLQNRLSQLDETATAGATSAGNVGVGAVYKNKAGKTPKNKDGTAKNALDMDVGLMTGGSIGKQAFIKR